MKIKKTDRILTFLLCLSLILTGIPEGSGACQHAKAAAPSYDGTLAIDTPVTVFLSSDPQKGFRDATYQFTPAESGSYTFYSIADQPTACYLRGSSGMTIDSDYTHHGRGQNFSLTCSLSADVVYYFTVQFSASSSTEGSFDICIIKTPDSTSYRDALSVNVAPKGIETSITAPHQTVYLTFTPTQTGHYAFYQLASCDCPDKDHRSDCTYLQELSITISKKLSDTGDTLIQTNYSTSEGKSGGFIIYDTFTRGITYYIAIDALDSVSIGAFKLGISQKLSDAPIDTWTPSGERTFTLEDNTEAIYLQTDTPGGFRLNSSDGSYVYAQLLTASGDIVSESSLSDQFMDFSDTVTPGKYYIRIYTDQALTQTFHVSLELVVPTTPPESNSPAPTVSPRPTNTPPTPETPVLPEPSDTQSPSVSASSDTGVHEVPSNSNSPSDASNLKKAHLSKIPDQTYTGKKLKPNPQLSFDGTPLKKGTDYTLSYKNNQKIGTAVITVTGKGLYSGQKRKISFHIVPPAPARKKPEKTGNTVSLRWKRVPKATGYEIQYAATSSYKKATKKQTMKINFTIPVTPGQKYYIRLRAYTIVKKQKYYSRYQKFTV